LSCLTSRSDINSDAQAVLHQVITLLLRLLRPARVYADIGAHGTTKLTAYFNLLSYCMVSKTEKLMASLAAAISPYKTDLFRTKWALLVATCR